MSVRPGPAAAIPSMTSFIWDDTEQLFRYTPSSCLAWAALHLLVVFFYTGACLAVWFRADIYHPHPTAIGGLRSRRRLIQHFPCGEFLVGFHYHIWTHMSFHSLSYLNLAEEEFFIISCKQAQSIAKCWVLQHIDRSYEVKVRTLNCV